MSGKQVEGGNRMLTSMVGLAAAYGARKIIHFAWKQITGKEPPEHPDDPNIALGEALAWSIALGIGMQTARMLATRATMRKSSGAGDSAE